MYVDSNVYCGIGGVQRDDTPGLTNRSNGSSPMYGRSDTSCWNYAEGHELMHNLGGVQPTAPNATPNFHCSDEQDKMCYDDDGTGPVVMRNICPASEANILDCGNNDYFAANPTSGSWLANHWNTANSSYLLSSGGGTPPPPPPPPPPPRNAVSNGGFESGTSSWSAFTTNGLNIVSNSKPHTGASSAWFAGYNNAGDYIYQPVTVPSNGVLRFWRYMTTAQTNGIGSDVLRVQLMDTNNYVIANLKDIANTDVANSWVQEALNLSGYAGRQLKILFRSSTDATGVTSWFMDDVSLTSG
jgi:hypothetical protein